MKHVARSLSRRKGEVRRKVGPHHLCIVQLLNGLSLHVPAISILFSQGTYFGSSTSNPEMDFSRSLVGHGSWYMWDSVPICPSPSPSPPVSPRPSSDQCPFCFFD